MNLNPHSVSSLCSACCRCSSSAGSGVAIRRAVWASQSDSRTIPEAVNTCTFESLGGSAPKQARAQLVLSEMRGKSSYVHVRFGSQCNVTAFENHHVQEEDWGSEHIHAGLMWQPVYNASFQE